MQKKAASIVYYFDHIYQPETPVLLEQRVPSVRKEYRQSKKLQIIFAEKRREKLLQSFQYQGEHKKSHQRDEVNNRMPHTPKPFRRLGGAEGAVRPFAVERLATCFADFPGFQIGQKILFVGSWSHVRLILLSNFFPFRRDLRYANVT
jgi:hypothetical protein